MNMAQKFRQAMQDENPLQIVGTVNAFTAIMAKSLNFRAIYLSGAGVANISYGLPDTGITTFDNILEDARRIITAVDIPLIVDIDTGFGNEKTIERVVKTLERAQIAGIHIEDQVFDKRCGHLEGKKLCSTDEMCLRIKAAVNARTNPDFCIIARVDGLGVEGLDKTIERALEYKNAGADIIFAEAVTSLQDYAALKKALKIPILANITEFGKTPQFSLQELNQAGVEIILYPLSAARAMNLAAFNVYKDIRENGTAKNSIPHMLTRDELYRFLNYKG
jgi:methylisocitrate lyase